MHCSQCVDGDTELHVTLACMLVSIKIRSVSSPTFSIQTAARLQWNIYENTPTLRRYFTYFLLVSFTALSAGVLAAIKNCTPRRREADSSANISSFIRQCRWSNSICNCRPRFFFQISFCWWSWMLLQSTNKRTTSRPWQVKCWAVALAAIFTNSK